MSAMSAVHAAPPTRHPGLDRLKVGLTGLVLLHHAAMTYGGAPGWFWHDPDAAGTATASALSLLVLVNQTFFMGLFFLLAGANLPAALARRGRAGFLGERVVRLGLPSLLFACGLGPLTVALAATFDGHAVGDVLAWAWRTGATYPGPMWFAIALLVLSGLAALRRSHRADAGGLQPFPSDLAVIAGVLVCGVLAFLLRLAWPVGHAVWGFQFGHFASYVLLFAAGVRFAERGHGLQARPGQARRWQRVTAWTLPAALLIFGVPAIGEPRGGWQPAAALYALWEPLVAAGFVFGLLAWARRHASPLGPLEAVLSRSAFAVYLLHPPVMVAVALALHPLGWPLPLRFAAVAVATGVSCVAAAVVLRRVPGLDHVL